MSTTSTIIASINPTAAAATILALLKSGYRVTGTLGPYSPYPEAATSIPWIRLPYMGVPDAFDPELEGVDYVVHVDGGTAWILEGKGWRSRGRRASFEIALRGRLGMLGEKEPDGAPFTRPLVT